MILNTITLILAFSFIFYGISCLLSKHMVLEFERFGLKNQRVLTGILQLLGGFGLLVGWYFKIYIVAFLAALGLGLLMFLGFGVRIKIKDTVLQALPSLIFGILNMYLAYVYFNMIL